jgi:UDP:flavonoid glycosyltransferase YjiC (YdhE family)
LTGRVFIRRPRPEQREIVAGSPRISWLEAPLPVQQAMDGARMVIHDGSMLVAEKAPVAGRPQLLAPVYLEHLVTARALAGEGVARIIRPGAGEPAIANSLRAAAADADMPAAAQAVSRPSPGRGQDPALPGTLLRRVLAEITP